LAAAAAMLGLSVLAAPAPRAPEALTQPGAVHAVAVAPDGRLAATGGDDGIVRVFELSSGKEVKRLEGHKGPVGAVRWAPDGKLLAAGDAAGKVRLWNAATGHLVWAADAAGPDVRSLAFSPDGARLSACGHAASGVVFDVATGQSGEPWRGAMAKEEVSSVAVSPDGRTALSGGQVTLNRGVSWSVFYLLDTRTGKLTGDRVEGPKLPPERRAQAAAARSPVAWAPDGATWAGGLSDGTVRLYEGVKEKAVLRGHAGPVVALVFLNDGKGLVTAGDDGAVRLWDATTGREAGQAKAAKGKVLALALTPDGKRLLLATDAGAVELRDLADVGK
jgi:WD40 repeat protein